MNFKELCQRVVNCKLLDTAKCEACTSISCLLMNPPEPKVSDQACCQIGDLTTQMVGSKADKPPELLANDAIVQHREMECPWCLCTAHPVVPPSPHCTPIQRPHLSRRPYPFIPKPDQGDLASE